MVTSLSLKKKRNGPVRVKNTMYKMITLYRLINLNNVYNYKVQNDIFPYLTGNSVDMIMKSKIYEIIKQPIPKILKNKRKLKRICFKARNILKTIKIIGEENIFSTLENSLNSSFKLSNFSKASLEVFTKKYEELFLKRFINKVYKKEMLYLFYTKVLFFNNNKYKEWFLLGLKKVISKIYKKEVSFNLVNLKYLHLNSDIFSEAIATKLRNRENRLLNVLNRSLRLARLPYSHRISIYGIKKKLKNRTFTVLKNPLFLAKPDTSVSRNDIIHNLLSNVYLEKKNNLNASQNSSMRNFFTKKITRRNKKMNLHTNVLSYLKNRAVLGVRLEAAGRLTRRLTASRSVFKLRYKGSLKNIDSSYKGLSSVMLRGNTKSNVQYTNINSKTRNGSFGLKG